MRSREAEGAAQIHTVFECLSPPMQPTWKSKLKQWELQCGASHWFPEALRGHPEETNGARE